ncbi:CHC2 zinc finger domain-containing protein [Mucilaginibacter kameinonensis]|uniref:CHC2 zinc finger domain-containing protein n=1 Tax=Mucilaginibacter kameinonensis TaxID=452286 RepID=UPI000EF7E313|nr:CHC2 zinc finger domain-containing protein [Mucilaginibacter kameinonensis]
MNAKNDYAALTAEAARIKSEMSLLDYFFTLENIGTLRYEGKKGKEYFFGFDHQKTGSISIKDKDNLWYDHALGEGGDIIKAVQKFENKTFVEAIKRLSNSTDIIADGYHAFFKKNGETELDIEIKKVLDTVQHPALINYLHSRGLGIKDVEGVAKEVHWSTGKDHFFAIGFQNANNGYAVRSSVYKGNLKGGGISTFTVGSQPQSIKLFEGSMDFASYRHLFPDESFNAILLNGTGNLTELLCEKINTKSIEKGIPVHTYFDNGRDGVGGKHATQKAIKLIKGATDQSSFYAEKGLNDINDFLMAQRGEYKMKR